MHARGIVHFGAVSPIPLGAVGDGTARPRLENEMTAGPSGRSPLPPRSGGDWPRRLVRHHLPLAGSTLVLVLWMTPIAFQASVQHGAQQAPATEHPAPAQINAPQASPEMAGHQAAPRAAGHGGTTPSADRQGAPQTATPPPASGDRTQDLVDRQSRALMARFTTATGYVATGLLALTLVIGPANLVLRRRNPVSSYLRRDVGAWTAIVSVVHVIAGLQVHGPPAPIGERISMYFFAPDGTPLLNAFGLGNWTGLAATVIVVGLLAISSDFALRTLKAGRWKWLQRFNYALFGLVVAHAIYYGALLRVTSFSTLVLGVSVSAVLFAQAVGIALYKRRYAPRSRDARALA